MHKPISWRDAARRFAARLAMPLLAGGMALTGSAVAAPGTPGVPQAPLVTYTEDFQNRPGPTPIVKLNAYSGTTGQTYTAAPPWLTSCNGWVSSANQPTAESAQIGDCVSQSNWNRAQQLSWALGLYMGQSQAAARDNYAVSAYTAGNPGVGVSEFETATNIAFPTSNRFVSFGVDVVAINCSASGPLLQFSLLDDGGNSTPAGSQINVCASTTTISIPALGIAGPTTAGAGTYTSNGAVLISGASVGVRMVNNNGSGTGNDHAFDNIRILDATPQLDKAFSPASIAAGQTATLTFTITNTTELGAKNGWSFTDTLPAGLVVTGPAATTTCPAGVVAAPANGSTIAVSGNLSAGLASCTATVSVTSVVPGSYTNDASNISSAVGINPPGSTTLTVTQPPTDLAITKTDGSATYTPGTDATYTIVASNNGPGDVVGARISDTLPAGISAATWTCGNATGGGVCGAPSGTGGINSTADLPVGASVTYVLNMRIPLSYSGILTNTATISAPAGTSDIDSSNNTASDTNTIAPPPTSGACAPRAVALGSTFSLAPFAVTGSVQKTGSWNSAPDPWTTVGGNYSITWTFSQPVPANWLQIAVMDVNAESPAANIAITLGAGSTASLADFAVVLGDLDYSPASGNLTRSGAVAGKQAAALQARNTTNTVTSITFTGTNIVAGDSIMNRIYVRPPCLTVSKVSEGNTGSFQIDMSNVGNAAGTPIANTSLTTAAAGTAVSSPQYFARDTRIDLSLSEVVPAGWNLSSAVCTDRNAGATGNPTVIGSFTAPTVTIPAANLRPESDIACLFTNGPQPQASIAKALVGESITDDDIAEPGETLTYEITVTHTGGPAFTDFDFIENLPDGATMVSVTGANGFTGPVAGPATVQLTVPTVPVGGTSVVTVELLVDAPIPLGVSNITNRISGGDVPEDCANCTVTIPTPTYTPVRPPTISCTTTGAYFNTAYNASTGGLLASGPEPLWEVALTTTPITGAPPADLAYGNATVVSNPPANYTRSPFGNANWISHNATAIHPTPVSYDIFYRYQFNLAPGVDPASLDLQMSFYSDNSVYEVWVNGVAQGIRSNYTADPYFYAGFSPGNGATGSMNGDWQNGLNTIVVHIKSGPGAQAFMAQIQTPALCRPKVTLRKIVVNDNAGTAVPADFTLRATGLAPLTHMIEGPMGDAAVTNASVPAGSYTLGEDNLTGYVGSTYSCSVDGAAAAPVSNNTLPLVNGQNAICTITNDDENPRLSIEKTGILNDLDGDGLIDLGETISYSFRVINDGNVTMTGVTVNDPLLANAGISVSPGPQALAPGGSAVFTATYMPTQADIDAGQVSNTATGTGTPPSGPPVTSPPDSAIVPPDQTPGLTVEKTGVLNDLDGDGLLDLGETITYSFRVTNSGTVTMTNVTVDDPLLANAGIAVTPGPQTLGPRGIATFTATYTPTQADIDAGSVANVATGTGTPPGGGTTTSPPDDVTVPPDQTPGLIIDKTGTLNDLDGDGLIDAGETITYSFVVTNTGAVTVSNVTVDDPLLAGAGIAVSPGPQTLAPGASATFTATYTPTQADIDAGQVSNTATGTGTPPSGPPITSPPDTVVVPPDQAPGLTVEKTGTLNDADGDGLIDLGETISYSFLVRNSGAVTLTGVTVDDPLLTNAGIAVTPGPQTLAPGGTVTFTATYTPTQADIDAGQVENTATGTGTPPSGPPVTSPPDTVVVPPDQTPGLTIEKTGVLNDLDGDGLLDLGETISYSFLVRNSGAVTMTNVTVNDPLLANAGVAVTPGPQTLGPGGSATFTATYTPTQADIDAGRVENTATGTGTPPSGPPTESPPDTVVVPPDQASGLTIVKTGTLNDLDGDGLIDLGETITYSFLVTNSGAVTLRNVTVDDPLLANAGIAVTPGPQTLAPGANVTFTATYTPNQADIDAGRVENTATGTGTPPSGPPVTSPPDTVVVPPDQTPGLIIEKTGTLNDLDGDGLLDPGETILYSFLATNSGAVTLTDVTINDPLLANAGIAVTPGPQTLAPGASVTFTASYAPTQAQIDAGVVENIATGTGTDPGGGIIESPPDSVTVPPQPASLVLVKTGSFNDLDGNGHASAGDTLTYTFTVTNDGGQTAADVWPKDPGPSFGGQPASAALSPFTPGPLTLAPGQQAVFTATYTLTETDVVNAAGAPDSVANTATAVGYINGNVITGTPVESEESGSLVTLPAAAGDVSVAKVALLRHIRRGEEAPFAITVTNNSAGAAQGLTIIDTVPSGFRFVEGSASIGGVAATPVVDGQRVIFENVTVPANSAVEIRLSMLALSSAGPGAHVNRAGVTDAGGNPLAPDATATVEILIEPIFDCSEIIGRVFDDRNRNGYQDEGEPGLPGVRLATVNGWLVTTDAHGRFHVACAALPDQRIGSNFIMKLDTRTLPTGYRLTTENPRVVRLTAGKMTSLDFGAAIGRVVRLDLQDEAFVPGKVALQEQWAMGVDQLIGVLAQEQSVLRLSYIDPGADPELAQERLREVSRLVRERWERLAGQYRLEIEMRVEAGL